MNKFSRLTSAVRSRKASAGILTAAVIAVVIALNVVLYTLSVTYGWFVYRTEELDLSISDATDAYFAQALAKAEEDKALFGEAGKVTVSFCMAKDELTKHNPGSFVHQTALNLAQKYPELIEIDYVNIITQMNSAGEPVDLSKYREVEGTDVLAPIYNTSLIFSYTDPATGEESFRLVTDYMTSAGFSSFFTLNSDMTSSSYIGEEIMSALIGWVLRTDHPTAYLTSGHGESISPIFSTMLTALGYNIKTVNIRDLSAAEVEELSANPKNVLIISNPTTNFGASLSGTGAYGELDRLEDYIERGGNLYVTLDPYVAVKNNLNLVSFLADYGISVSTYENKEADVSFRNIVKDTTSSIPGDGYTLVGRYADDELAEKIKANTELFGSGKVLLREAAALTLTPGKKATATEVLVSSPSAICVANGATTDTEGSYCLAANAVVVNEGGKNANLFVIATSYVTVTEAIVSEGYSNKDFVYAVFDEIFSAQTPPYGCKSIMVETGTLQGLTMGTARIYTLIAVLIPTAIAVTGAVIVIRRKRR